METKKILVTGGAGYIGSVLVKDLLNKGHQVRIVDNLLYDSGVPREVEFIRDDINNDLTISRAIKGVDAIIHLAAISNDPGCDLNPMLSIKTNLNSTIKLAQHAKLYGIKKFLFASSCSVYGAKKDDISDEKSDFAPVSLYATLKLAAEQALISMREEGVFEPVFLRNATVYGLSDRMRFDLAVNIFTLHAKEYNKLTVFGGEQWRPLVHVNDVSKAFQMAMEAPDSKVGGQAFNVVGENYKINNLADRISKITGAEVEIKAVGGDIRSYNVSGDKFRQQLQFNNDKRIEHGVKEIYEALENNVFKDPLQNTKYYCVEHLKKMHWYQQ